MRRTPHMKTLPRHKAWVARPNHSLNIKPRNTLHTTQSLPGIPTPTQRIVLDLRALAVAHEHELRARALGREGGDLGVDGFDARLHGLGVGVAAAGGLAAAGWVVDHFGGRAGVGVEDSVDEGGGGAVAGWGGGFAGAEDVAGVGVSWGLVEEGRRGEGEAGGGMGG